MRFPPLLTVSLVAAFFCSTPALRAGEVGVVIKKINLPAANSKPDPKKKKGGAPPPDIDSIKLEIQLQNNTQKDLKGLKLKYYIFSHAAGSSTPTIEKQDEKSVDLVPSGKASVTTDIVTTTMQPAYSVKGKRLPATGSKISGQAAQVFNGDTLLGESFSSETFKAVVNPPPAKPGAAH